MALRRLERRDALFALGGVAVGLGLRFAVRFARRELSSKPRAARVAVVLSGCGYLDGSEIHESVSCVIRLQQAGAVVTYFAPDVAQARVMNHLTKEPVLAAPLAGRNALVEAARIARSDVCALSTLAAGVGGFDACVLPGGFGAATTLCDFASGGGASGSVVVNADLTAAVAAFAAAGKPLGFACIAPVIAARLLPGVTLTVGGASDASAACERMGARHVVADVRTAIVDVTKRVVTTPAFMIEGATSAEVFEGIGAMIREVLTLVK